MFLPKLDVLPPAQRALWPLLADLPGEFVLYGGTAVALRLGHGLSLDFDFFTARSLSPVLLYEQIPWLGRSPPAVLQRAVDTFVIEAEGPRGVP